MSRIEHYLQSTSTLGVFYKGGDDNLVHFEIGYMLVFDRFFFDEENDNEMLTE